MKYYFNDFIAPNIYTFTSEYTYQKFIFEDAGKDGLGIGLDMFLGSNYDYKRIDPNNPAFSDYLTKTFSREYMVKMMIEILVNDRLGRVPGSRLIDHMIHNGKQLYILEKVLPQTPDSILLEYTTAETEWVKNNKFGGVMFWSLEQDDFDGTKCGEGKYPLINAAREVLKGNKTEEQDMEDK